MTHLTITIEVPIDCRISDIPQQEAEYYAKEAYKAVRKAIPYWTQYNEQDFIFKITK